MPVSEILNLSKSRTAELKKKISKRGGPTFVLVHPFFRQLNKHSEATGTLEATQIQELLVQLGTRGERDRYEYPLSLYTPYFQKLIRILNRLNTSAAPVILPDTEKALPFSTQILSALYPDIDWLTYETSSHSPFPTEMLGNNLDKFSEIWLNYLNIFSNLGVFSVVIAGQFFQMNQPKYTEMTGMEPQRYQPLTLTREIAKHGVLNESIFGCVAGFAELFLGPHQGTSETGKISSKIPQSKTRSATISRITSS